LFLNGKNTPFPSSVDFESKQVIPEKKNNVIAPVRKRGEATNEG
jgi:hypothetical protein